MTTFTTTLLDRLAQAADLADILREREQELDGMHHDASRLRGLVRQMVEIIEQEETDNLARLSRKGVPIPPSALL